MSVQRTSGRQCSRSAGLSLAVRHQAREKPAKLGRTSQWPSPPADSRCRRGEWLFWSLFNFVIFCHSSLFVFFVPVQRIFPRLTAKLWRVWRLSHNKWGPSLWKDTIPSDSTSSKWVPTLSDVYVLNTDRRSHWNFSLLRHVTPPFIPWAVWWRTWLQSTGWPTSALVPTAVFYYRPSTRSSLISTVFSRLSGNLTGVTVNFLTREVIIWTKLTLSTRQ